MAVQTVGVPCSLFERPKNMNQDQRRSNPPTPDDPRPPSAEAEADNIAGRPLATPESASPHQSVLNPQLLETQAKAWLAAIVDCSDDAIVSKTLEGVITSWNAGAERIFGYKASEIIGKPIYCLIPTDRQDEEPRILDCLRRGERVDHFESERVTKDGRRINVSLTISPIRDESGQIVGVSKIARDITERKLAEQALREAKEAAELANKAKDNFLAILSHELRTPLTPILASVTAIEQWSNLPADLREEIGMIRRNVEQESRLIDDLLDLNEISREKIQLDFKVIDVHESLRDVLAMYGSEFDSHRIEVSLELQADHRRIWADPDRIRQVFWNVVQNSIKFTPQGGHLRVRTLNDADGRLIVRFQDDGIGIEPEVLPKIFDAFQQGNRTLMNGLGGLGIGLSIAKKLVTLHQGQITATSAGTDQGTTITVSFRTLPTLAAGTSDPKNILEAKPDAYRILLVEDHLDTLRIVARSLTRLGYAVQTASSVREALERVDNEPFDLLVSDIGLPDGNGLDIMRYVKKKHGLKGIALSGFGMEKDLSKSRAAGFEVHLTKPVNMDVLTHIIERVSR